MRTVADDVGAEDVCSEAVGDTLLQCPQSGLEVEVGLGNIGEGVDTGGAAASVGNYLITCRAS